MFNEGNQELSNFLGWVSIACWLVVYSPQILENYRKQSGEGLSVSFVTVWLIGDICNLTGAVMANLIPTIVILGSYYSVCDVILLTQIYYYRWKKARRTARLLLSDEPETAALYGEASPLLPGGTGSEVPARRSMSKDTLKFASALLFVFAVGVAAWAVDKHVHRDSPRSKPEEVIEWRSQVLGWISAALFLGARVPQIVKNLDTRCEGLSPFLFVYSISGNTTYFLSILAASLNIKHLAANAPWIAGSALTVFLDLFVLYQFFLYRQEDNKRADALERECPE
ncbi:PQ-loop-domain-containing protein [Trametes versicolor FP-101664 SS1]|uniref:PQ-loop-domain-containing protein n=1 Tax=Trametes versicolor (strain FP-101664) TaxID=717944 RepID=UPI0004623502|nr:PQ-loop-domain-containing protein [Trametes versicolor FP-101664 SS1]EIW59688.1 PQ-loop-domain-containing protein [Trametes versicolor FP-101664 SS1]